LAVRDDVSAPHHALGFEAGEKPQHREQAEDEVCGQALLEDNSINHQSGVARRDRRSLIAVANLSGFGESRNERRCQRAVWLGAASEQACFGKAGFQRARVVADGGRNKAAPMRRNELLAKGCGAVPKPWRRRPS
jgi:hypothetical protein